MESKPTNHPIGMLRPFGPSIVKTKLPDILVQQLNEYTDAIIADESKLKKLDHSPFLAGNVRHEITLEQEFVKKIKWTEFLGYVCNEWLRRDSGRELRQIQLISSWIVRQFQNEYNPVHHHTGHISGVAYLKVPSNMGNTVREGKKANSNGKLIFLSGSANMFSPSALEITPEVGDFYIFPNYLDHAVYPFSNTDEERRSVSFNAILDAEAVAY